MSLAFGALQLDNCMIGSFQVDRAMIGTDEVWSAIKGNRLFGRRRIDSTTIEIVELNPDTAAVISVIGNITNIAATNAGLDFGGSKKRAFFAGKYNNDAAFGLGEFNLKNASVIRYLPAQYSSNSHLGIGGNADYLVTSGSGRYLAERNQDTLAIIREGTKYIYVHYFDGVGHLTPCVGTDTSDDKDARREFDFATLSGGGGAASTSYRYDGSFAGLDTRFFCNRTDTTTGNITEYPTPPRAGMTQIQRVNWPSSVTYSLFGVKS